jgi:hypothetical protein
MASVQERHDRQGKLVAFTVGSYSESRPIRRLSEEFPIPTPSNAASVSAARRRADARAQELEVDRRKGTLIDDSRMTFEEFAEEWRKNQLHRISTAKTYESALRLRVYPVIGSKRMASIRASACQSLVKHLSDTLAPANARNVASLVSSVFKAAVTDRKIPYNPMDTVKRPMVDDEEVTILPVETIAARSTASRRNTGP